ncbi:hypothetical protein, partial [Pseudenhygromyxa sp. WMMC2535]|uniref:hypothetical protein n=1 Tax=Pseudenhygromyxa sp. WMMC2535 TaxID=2712867 RepID=UPI001C3CAB8B
IAFATLRPLRASNYAVDDLLKPPRGSRVSRVIAPPRASPPQEDARRQGRARREDVEAVRARSKPPRSTSARSFLPSEMLADDLRSRDRLAKLSVTDTVSLKAALREYLAAARSLPRARIPSTPAGASC